MRAFLFFEAQSLVDLTCNTFCLGFNTIDMKIDGKTQTLIGIFSTSRKYKKDNHRVTSPLHPLVRSFLGHLYVDQMFLQNFDFLHSTVNLYLQPNLSQFIRSCLHRKTASPNEIYRLLCFIHTLSLLQIS